MNQLQVIHEQSMLGQVLQVYNNLENPLFLAKDVAEWIEYAGRTGQMLSTVDEEEKLTHTIYASGQNREMWFLTEDGLYEVLMQSRKPIARAFKKEVKYMLKNIRKHGAHMTVEKIEEALLNPDTLIKLAQNLKDEQVKRQMAEQAVVEANRIIEAQQPKVLFADSVSASDTSILIREFAKILQQNGINLGEKRLFEWLRKNGYLIKRMGADYNSPTQRSMDLKLFEVKETTVNRTVGIQITRTPKITGKGQLYFLSKLQSVAQ